MAHLWIPGQLQPHQIVDDYSDAKHEAHPHGVILIDGKEVASTLQCPHCMRHFVSRKGSGAKRGYCLNCQAVHCGDPQCWTCTPFVAALGQAQGRMV